MRIQVESGWWEWDRASSGGGQIVTFTSPRHPHNGKPGEVLYVRCSPGTGWRMYVADEIHGHLEDVNLAIVLSKTPSELHKNILEAERKMMEECGRIANNWIVRRQNYRRELLGQGAL